VTAAMAAEQMARVPAAATADLAALAAIAATA